MSLSAPVAHAVESLQLWLKELRENAELADDASAYAVLRSVLHQLRDRLTMDEATNLGAQLPVMVRGLYYEGWRPHQVPRKIRSRQIFLDELSEELLPHTFPVEWAVTSVFGLLAHHCDPGEIAHVIGQMPDDLKDLWPASVRHLDKNSAKKTEH